MRRVIVLFGLAGVACGSNSASSGGVSGTVGGTAFVPSEIVAARAEPGPCVVPGGLPAGDVAAVAIRFATFSGSCADLVASQCASHRNSRSVTLIVARAAVPPASAAVGPATYTVVANPGSFSLSLGGTAELAIGNSTSTDAACADSSSTATGSVRLDEVSASRVAGHVDVSFEDGGKLQGDFSALVCPAAPDACTVAKALVAAQAICTGPPACP